MERHVTGAPARLIACISLAVAVMVATAPVAWGQSQKVVTGTVTRVEGTNLVLEGGRTLQAVNEHLRIPDWVKPGTRVKVAAYAQGSREYYVEIVKPGDTLRMEQKPAPGSRRGG